MTCTTCGTPASPETEAAAADLWAWNSDTTQEFVRAGQFFCSQACWTNKPIGYISHYGETHRMESNSRRPSS